MELREEERAAATGLIHIGEFGLRPLSEAPPTHFWPRVHLEALLRSDGAKGGRESAS